MFIRELRNTSDLSGFQKALTDTRSPFIFPVKQNKFLLAVSVVLYHPISVFFL